MRTGKNLVVKNKPLATVKEETIRILKEQGFRINEKSDVLTCTRGFGLITAQQKCVLSFAQKGNDTEIAGDFFIAVFWFMESTVDEDAVAAAIPRRKGYKLMREYINAIGAEEV